jgi:hypothetical protein
MNSNSPNRLQSAMLMGSPCFPNAISWSQDNLIAVASGNLVTILVLSLSLSLLFTFIIT